jgi:hypothetical protein
MIWRSSLRAAWGRTDGWYGGDFGRGRTGNSLCIILLLGM